MLFRSPQIAVIEIIAATAVVPTVAALGKIAMRYGVELQGRERNEPLMTIGVNIHKSHKAEACDAEVEAEVHHAMSLGGGVDISAHEVTAGVELHHVNALKAKRRRQNLRAIKLRQPLAVVVVERHGDRIEARMLHETLRRRQQSVGVKVKDRKSVV